MLLPLFMFYMVSHWSEALGTVAATPDCRPTTNNVVLYYIDRQRERENEQKKTHNGFTNTQC
jgi:hypothetical protein